MVLLLSLLIVFLLIHFGNGAIRRHAAVFYWLSAAISVCVVLFVVSGLSRPLTGNTRTFANIFLQGGLAGAMFIAVMYAGAVPGPSAFRRRVMPIRGPLSIMASILTLGHNIAYGKTYFVYLFTAASSLRTNVLLAAICSLIMIAIMLPLFITSFQRVRRRMNPKSWKRLQRLAYLFYALMFVHVLLLNTSNAREGKTSAILNVALYSLLFLVYASLRLSRAAKAHGHETWTAAIQLACSAAMIFGLVLIFMPTHKNSLHRETAAAAAVAAEPHATATGAAEAGATKAGAAETGAAEADAAETGAAETDTTETGAAEAGTTKTGSTETGTTEAGVAEATSTVWADGKYKGAAIGYNGRLTVSVIIKDGAIESVKCTGSVEDEPYITDATTGVFASMIENNTADVDAVSGATTTSDALIAAVREALDKATEAAQ